MLKKYVYYTVGETYKIPIKYTKATIALFHDKYPRNENETDEEYVKRLYDDLSIERWIEPSSTKITETNTLLTIRTEENDDDDDSYDETMNKLVEDVTNGKNVTEYMLNNEEDEEDE